MHSTSDPKQADPDGDILVARLEEAIARGPKPLSRVQEQVSKLERDAERYSSDQQIPVNTFRLTVPRDRPALRGLIGLILAGCIFVAAFALQSSYGDAVKADYRPVGAAARSDFITAARKTFRTAEPT